MVDGNCGSEERWWRSKMKVLLLKMMMMINDVLEDEFSSDEGGEGTHGNLWMV